MSADLPEIPGYRIERVLGEGGMATVYLATQLSLERPVAIKVLTAGDAGGQQALRFEREARMLAALEHPHIVGIFEVGRTGTGRPFYVMPYLPNGDLAARRLTGDEAAIAAVLDAVLAALEHAHAHGIVHRDVKPANVLFDAFDQPRLADFGIARPAAPDAGRLTAEGMAVGSGWYMAPEQARGDETDARADLYSVGVMAYELLTGEPPFRGPDALAVALQHLTAEVPRLPASLGHWQGFIDRALAKRPEDRFPDARAMRAALAELRRAAPARPRRLRPWLAVAAGAALLAAIALLALRPRPGSSPEFFVHEAEPTAEAAPPAAEPVDPGAAVAALLAEARSLIDEERLAAPPERNAATLILAALRVAPESAEAKALLAEVERRLLLRAEEALAAGAAETLRKALGELDELAAMLGETEGGRLRATLRARLGSNPATAGRAPALTAVLADFGLAAAAPPVPEAHPPPVDRREAASPPPAPFLTVPSELGDARARSHRLRPLAALPRPVSRSEFERFVRETGHRPAPCRGEGPLGLLGRRSWRDPGFDQAADDPVVCVSYADATAYASWLGRRLGRVVRLPSAEELQHVALHQLARGGALSLREWSADCAGRACRRRLVLDPGLDGRAWPLVSSPAEAGRGHPDVGFRLVLD
ncbi:MAG: bifunctional serine/threonine-protein kinase/formylglycine-generating enzyme family protein [Xanthomonadales bacterium]|nr:bifunctional serine/threonine-protein kinase/formylglycine-generating enzyme family protein [Xanthomonadales bacterium]